jgi:hypothetical protein
MTETLRAYTTANTVPALELLALGPVWPRSRFSPQGLITGIPHLGTGAPPQPRGDGAFNRRWVRRVALWAAWGHRWYHR